MHERPRRVIAVTTKLRLGLQMNITGPQADGLVQEIVYQGHRGLGADIHQTLLRGSLLQAGFILLLPIRPVMRIDQLEQELSISKTR